MEIKFEASIINLENRTIDFVEVVNLGDNSSDGEIEKALKEWAFTMLEDCESPDLLDDYSQQAESMGWSWVDYLCFTFGDNFSGRWETLGTDKVRGNSDIVFYEDLYDEYRFERKTDARRPKNQPWWM